MSLEDTASLQLDRARSAYTLEITDWTSRNRSITKTALVSRRLKRKRKEKRDYGEDEESQDAYSTKDKKHLENKKGYLHIFTWTVIRQRREKSGAFGGAGYIL